MESTSAAPPPPAPSPCFLNRLTPPHPQDPGPSGRIWFLVLWGRFPLFSPNTRAPCVVGQRSLPAGPRAAQGPPAPSWPRWSRNGDVAADAERYGCSSLRTTSRPVGGGFWAVPPFFPPVCVCTTSLRTVRRCTVLFGQYFLKREACFMHHRVRPRRPVCLHPCPAGQRRAGGRAAVFLSLAATQHWLGRLAGLGSAWEIVCPGSSAAVTVLRSPRGRAGTRGPWQCRGL